MPHRVQVLGVVQNDQRPLVAQQRPHRGQPRRRVGIARQVGPVGLGQHPQHGERLQVAQRGVQHPVRKAVTVQRGKVGGQRRLADAPQAGQPAHRCHLPAGERRLHRRQLFPPPHKVGDVARDLVGGGGSHARGPAHRPGLDCRVQPVEASLPPAVVEEQGDLFVFEQATAEAVVDVEIVVLDKGVEGGVVECHQVVADYGAVGGFRHVRLLRGSGGKKRGPMDGADRLISHRWTLSPPASGR